MDWSIYIKQKEQDNSKKTRINNKIKVKNKQTNRRTRSRQKRTSHVDPPSTFPPIHLQNAHWTNHVSIHSFPTAPRRLMLSLAALVCSVSNITSSSAPS